MAERNDKLTEVLRLWASRYSTPIENLSTEKLVTLIERFLTEENGERKARRESEKRWDHEVIENIIPADSRVLDLGCGGGELLARLALDKNVRGQGIEIDPEKVFECVGRGVSVFQSDLDAGLDGWTENLFDYVILEETLQTVHNPARVLSEMLRVGQRGIVSFPNFAYWHIRLEIGLGGKMPVNPSLPYRWYDTPNIRLFTIEDFTNLADGAGVVIIEGHVLAEGDVRAIREDDNLFAEEVLFVIESERG